MLNSGRSDKQDPLLIIVSAPSGSGKTTIVELLLKKMTGVSRSISYTTRAPREGEKNNEDYIFVTREEFTEKAAKGEFLEWEQTFGNCYGTDEGQVKDALARGEDFVLSIDVKGARKVREKYPESISVFIMPPSEEELETRLLKRATDEGSEISIRLEESKREIAASDEYDYVIVNEELDEAVDELYTIIEKERSNRGGK